GKANQTELRSNDAGSDSELGCCMLFAQAPSDFIQKRRANYKIVGDGQRIVCFEQGKGSQERRTINGYTVSHHASLRSYQYTALLPRKSRKRGLFGVDVVVYAEIALIA